MLLDAALQVHRTRAQQYRTVLSAEHVTNTASVPWIETPVSSNQGCGCTTRQSLT